MTDLSTLSTLGHPRSESLQPYSYAGVSGLSTLSTLSLSHARAPAHPSPHPLTAWTGWTGAIFVGVRELFAGWPEGGQTRTAARTASLAALLALPGCDGFPLGLIAGAILGAAAALWRVRTARVADRAPESSAGHWQGVRRRRRA